MEEPKQEPLPPPAAAVESPLPTTVGATKVEEAPKVEEGPKGPDHVVEAPKAEETTAAVPTTGAPNYS